VAQRVALTQQKPLRFAGVAFSAPVAASSALRGGKRERRPTRNRPDNGYARLSCIERKVWSYCVPAPPAAFSVAA